METLKIDGSIGHGGGQILRSALALSAILGKPFEMHSIRKDRNQSGLRRQHLCGVLATAEICGAKLEGAELGSEDLLFIPKKIKAGTYQFAVGCLAGPSKRASSVNSTENEISHFCRRRNIYAASSDSGIFCRNPCSSYEPDGLLNPS